MIQLTSASGCGGSGDITVASAINWTTAATLTLSAYRDIIVNADIVSTGGGGVVLRADNTGTGTGTVTFGHGANRDRRGGVDLLQSGRQQLYDGQRHELHDADRLQLLCQRGEFADGRDAGQHRVRPAEPQQQSGRAPTRSAATSMPAPPQPGTAVQVSHRSAISAQRSRGSFDGQGHTISGLAINRPATNYVGLFGYIESGVKLSNVTMQGASVVGAQRVGILAGWSRAASAMRLRPAPSRPATWRRARRREPGQHRQQLGCRHGHWGATSSSSMGGLAGWNNGRHHPGQPCDR